MAIGASWKTSASGISGAASTLLLLFSGFVAFASGAPYHIAFPGWVQALSGFIGVTGGLGLAGSMASLGLASKDFDVTGGKVAQVGPGMIPVADPDTVARLAAPAGPFVGMPAGTYSMPAPTPAAPIINVAPARPPQPVVAAPQAIRW